MATAAAAGLSREAYLGVSSTLVVLCAGSVSIRCFTELKKSKRLLVDDYLSILGLILVTVAFAMNNYIYLRFTNPMEYLDWLIKTAVAITVIIGAMLWVTKAPILFVYVRIFGIQKWLAWTCYGTLAVTGLAYIGVMIPTFVRCHPYEEPMTPLVLQECVSGNTLTGVITGFLALATDVLIFLLPLPSVSKLQLPTSKKLGLAAVFGTGILGIAASIVSVYYKYRANSGETSDTLAAMLCAVAEGTIAIMIGCAPAMKNFWTTFISRPETSIPSSMYPNLSRTKRTDYSSDDYQLMDAESGRGSAHRRPSSVGRAW